VASEVDICNDALAMLGDVANVSSIKPPDNSAQAGHCARFYPKARDALLDLHPWNFATKRVQLALLSQTSNQWQYAYAMPADCMKALKVIDPNSPDDFSVAIPLYGVYPFPYPGQNNVPAVYADQPYIVETSSSGDKVLYTNQQDALLIYTAFVTDTTKFSPLFIEGLTAFLASKLAGPIIKGDEGRKVAASMRQEFLSVWLPKAAMQDANQRHTLIAQSVAWITNR
jgi:hypothetical protein